MIHVSFQHWCHVFSDRALIRYGSPHFDRHFPGQALRQEVVGSASLVDNVALPFPEEAILCANEAFPEAAVADPLADLEIWDEWSTGVRSFPYPGKYGRLGIHTQMPKTASTASVGVIGEIMAGLFAQQGVAPWVLVRVIQKWPDFIFAEQDGRYAFVEAKASAQTLPSSTGLMGRVAPGLLDECLVEAVQQLNADPYGRVWGRLRISGA
jgi:hypothetical protein